MHVSERGLSIIKEFEGYMKALPNGDCMAYRCYVAPGVHDGKWTIGWGCTEGITEGLVWTRTQAEEGLKREITRFEDAVTRLVKFVPNQNQFDALVSLAYNIGEGGLSKSSVLRLANLGDMAGAARSFSLWNKSQSIVVGGLVRRRAKEAVLFMELAPGEEALSMPQSVDVPDEGLSPVKESVIHNTQQVAVGTGIVGTILTSLGMMPAEILGFIKSYGISITLVGLGALFVFSEILKNFKEKK